MLSLDITIKVIANIEKVSHGFLWKGRKDVRGYCLVAWQDVCAPTRVGGLGIPNLWFINLALRSKWYWLQRTEVWRPWQETRSLICTSPGCLKSFEAAASALVRNGLDTLFGLFRDLIIAELRSLALIF